MATLYFVKLPASRKGHMKPPIDTKERGWTQNSRGGWQRPDHEIDLTDIPEMKDSKLVHRGPFPEYLKRRREQRQADKLR
jgi:hypothetical protein